MCLGFRQAVCTGFQICERVRGYLAVRSGCTGNGTFVCVIEWVVFIYYRLRFSFGCCFDQLFQLELNTFQEYFLALIIGFRVLLDDIQYKLRVLQLVGQHNIAAAAGDGSIGGCGWRCSCAGFAVLFAFCCCFSRYNIRFAVNRNGSIFRCLFKFAILYRTFHNAVNIVIIRTAANRVLIQVVKGIQPAVICMANRNIFAARGRVVNNLPFGIRSTVFALELDVNLVRLVRCTKDRTICIFPELVELNVDQCAPGVGKDCGNWGGICLLNLAFHHGVVVDHMGGMAISRNGYALQSGTIVVFDFLDGIAGANGDAGDGSGVIGIFAHFDLNILYDVPIFQTLTANIIKGNFELVGSGQGFIICGLLLDFQPAGFDLVDVFYL